MSEIVLAGDLQAKHVGRQIEYRLKAANPFSKIGPMLLGAVAHEQTTTAIMFAGGIFHAQHDHEITVLPIEPVDSEAAS